MESTEKTLKDTFYDEAFESLEKLLMILTLQPDLLAKSFGQRERMIYDFLYKLERWVRE